MNRIAELRNKHGYSQVELSDKLDIAQNTLSQYETGKREPSYRVISRLASIFGVTPNYVLGFPEVHENDDMASKKADITSVTVIRSTTSEKEANMYLELNWILLHVGQKMSMYGDGTGSANVIYTLGWTGDPKETLQNPLDEDETEIW